MTDSPSNTDLREAIISSIMIFTNRNSREDKFVLAFADDLLSVFQAREQKMLTELLGKKRAVKTYGDANVYFDAVPVSVIERLREGN